MSDPTILEIFGAVQLPAFFFDNKGKCDTVGQRLSLGRPPQGLMLRINLNITEVTPIFPWDSLVNSHSIWSLRV